MRWLPLMLCWGPSMLTASTAEEASFFNPALISKQAVCPGRPRRCRTQPCVCTHATAHSCAATVGSASTKGALLLAREVCHRREAAVWSSHTLVLA